MRLCTFILIGILFSIFVNSRYVFAQDKFNAGLKVGAGVSSLRDNNYGANKLHGHIGLPLNFRLNEHLEFQFLPLISSKGYSSSFYKPAERLNLYYLDLMAAMKYIPWKIFFISGGGYTGGLLYSHYRYLAYSKDYYGEPDISNIVNKLDFGLNGSIGCQFGNGIGLEVSLFYGLQDVFNSHSSDTLVGYSGLPYIIPPDANGKNRVISTSVYYLFGEKSK